MRTIWVYAAPAEGAALGWSGSSDDPGRGCLALGVGKAAAACALTAALGRTRADRVVAIGVCGAHRGAGLAVGSTCVVAHDRMIDEGVRTPDGFLDLGQLGLGDTAPLLADGAQVEAAARLLGAVVVGGGTVSTCSGTDALAFERAARWPEAAIETMEGAAIALACATIGVPWVAVRVVSNFTGDRDRAQWDLHGALGALGQACAALRGAGW